MIRLFKKLDITGVAVLLMAFFVAVGFTAAEEMQPTWYEVEIIDEDEDHNEPENQGIGAPLPGNPTGDCTRTSGTICAVQLTIGPGAPTPADKEEALELHEDDDTDVYINGESFKL